MNRLFTILLILFYASRIMAQETVKSDTALVNELPLGVVLRVGI